MAQAMLAALMLEDGCRVWRNNIMVATNKKGQRYRAGLPSGTSDWVGLYRGVFLAIETKYNRKPTAAQSNFLNSVNENGGIGLVCDRHNVHSIAEIVKQAWTERISRLATFTTGEAPRAADASTSQ